MYYNEPIQLVYVSSRQAIDPGPAVPGYAISNWAVLQLPKVLKVNLGRNSDLVQAFSLMFPFIRTGMTDEYVNNDRVFGRWQSRMLEPHEMAEAFMALLARPGEETDDGMFELWSTPGTIAMSNDQETGQIKFAEEQLEWSAEILSSSNSQQLVYGEPAACT